jgi:glycerol 2-dehydrogenase (NADP+)
MNHKVITPIANRLGATPAQVVLSWGVQRGTIVIPKSENPQRMKENITVRPIHYY